MQNRRLNQTLRLAGTIIAFALLVVLLSRQGWDEIISGVRAIPPWRFGVAISLMLVSRTVVAARWYTLLRSAGVTATFRSILRITFAGLFASNFLPTTIGGDVVRLAMALRMDFDKVVATASLAVDRLVGMAGMASAAPIGLIPLLSDPGAAARGTQAAGGLVGLNERLRGILRRLLDALGLWLHSPRGLLLAFGWTWVHQLCIFSVVWLMLGGLGEEIPFWLVSGLWSFTYFLTLMPVSINGLGLQEISMTAIFSSLGGVAVGSAAIAALLVRTIQMLASLPGSAFLSDIVSGMPPLREDDIDARRF